MGRQASRMRWLVCCRLLRHRVSENKTKLEEAFVYQKAIDAQTQTVANWNQIIEKLRAIDLPRG
jgi:hypothetical protein